MDRKKGTYHYHRRSTVPVQVHETAGNANPYVKVSKQAVKDLIERKDRCWNRHTSPRRVDSNRNGQRG